DPSRAVTGFGRAGFPSCMAVSLPSLVGVPSRGGVPGGAGLNRGRPHRANVRIACVSRLARVIVALLAIAVTLVLAVAAPAAPTVHLRAEPVPIPGFPHTGYILGHGAALKAEYRIEGHEYFGFPPPLIGVTFFLPKGTTLHPSGFPTCPKATLEPA